tara:strand:+ start:616 stop:1062 length:447 start_codon:yes stop_codon:yes gene_type:complete
MAILDKSKTSFINDNDESVSIGIENIFEKGDVAGWFKTTKTTLTAVKENIKAVLNTEKGERFMQPNIGLSLRRILFNPITSDSATVIQEEILSMMGKYFPYVTINEIFVDTEGDSPIDKALIKVHLSFMINNNPNLLDTVEVEFQGEE